MQLKRRKMNTNIIMLAICIIILFAIPLIGIGDRGVPFVFNDEYGYWATASYLNGFNWGEIISKIPYYSFGYGVLLAVIVAIAPSMGIAYKIALAFNGVWLVMAFLFLWKSCKYMFPKLSDTRAQLIAFTSTLFCSNYVQAHFTWPECFLYMLFCMCVYLVIKITYTRSRFSVYLLAIAATVSYYIHQRTISILIATCLVVVILLIKRKIKLVDFILMLLIMAAIYVVGAFCKGKVIANVWSSGEGALGSDISSQSNKFSYILTWNGFLDLVLSFLGKYYYVMAASFFVVPIAVSGLIKRVIHSIKNKRLSDDAVISIFLVVSLILTIGVNAFFYIIPGNLTHFVYGRYTDNVLGPFMMIGIVYLITKTLSSKEVVAHIGILIFSTIAIVLSFYRFGVHFQAPCNAVGVAYFVNEKDIDIYIGNTVILIVGLLFVLISTKVKNTGAKILFVSLILNASMIYTGLTAYDMYVGEDKKIISNAEEQAKIIANVVESNENVTVCAIMPDHSYGYPIRYAGIVLQYELGPRKVYPIDCTSFYLNDEPISVDSYPGIVYFVHSDFIDIPGMRYVTGNEDYSILISEKDEDLFECFDKLGYITK